MNDYHFSIRDMEVADLPYAMAIDATVYTAPWSKSVYWHELEKNPCAYYAVVEVNHCVVGYAGAWIDMDDAQITNIVVNELYRGYRFGKALFKHMLQTSIYMGAERLSLEVRASNHIAQNMYRQFGLVACGTQKNYYKDNQEDAVVMWVKLK